MNKIKNCIWIKLRKFLCIDNIENEFRKHETKNKYEVESLQYQVNSNYKTLNKNISHFQESVNTLHTTVENVVHIGTDVHYAPDNYNHSWAVICVEGKINIVKFIPLDRKDARDIMHFLKHFESGRHCVDTPYKEMFYNGLFKF